MATIQYQQTVDTPYGLLSPTRSLKRKVDSFSQEELEVQYEDIDDFVVAQAVVAPLRIRRYNSTSGNSSRASHRKSPGSNRVPRKSASISEFGSLALLSVGPFEDRRRSIVSNNTIASQSEAKSESPPLSISKFPRPPSTADHKASVQIQSPPLEHLPSTVYSPPSQSQRHWRTRRRVSSFDTYGSQSSIESARLHAFQRLNRSSEDTASVLMADQASSGTDQGRHVNLSIGSSASGKETPPPRALFEDLPTAHSSILRVTNSKWKVGSTEANRDTSSAQSRPSLLRSKTSFSPLSPNNFSSPTSRPDSPLIHPDLNTFQPMSPLPDEATQTGQPVSSWRGRLSSLLHKRSKSPVQEIEDIDMQAEVPLTPLSPPPQAHYSSPRAPYQFEMEETMAGENIVATRSSICGMGLGEEDELSPSALAYFEGRSLNSPEPEDDDLLYEEALDSSAKQSARSTVGSFLKHYGDKDHTTLLAPEVPELPSSFHSDTLSNRPTTSHSAVSRATSRFSQFDFGINQSGQIDRHSDSNHSERSLQASALGITVYPSEEPKSSSHPSQLDRDSEKLALENLDSAGISDEVLAAAKSSSGPLTDLSEKDLNTGGRKSALLARLRSRPDLSRNPSSHSTRFSGVSKASSEGAKSSLDREISQELRRISQLSGMSRVSGTVLVFNDGHVAESIINNNGNEEPAMGQTSADEADDFSTRDNSHDYLGTVDDDDDANEWETVTGSRAFSRSMFLSRPGLIRDATGSSIADFSDDEDNENMRELRLLPEDRKKQPLSPVAEILQHPADERFKHSYRFEQGSPDGEPILLPAYDFSSSTAFPNRNALSPPTVSDLFVDKAYKHPEPLPRSHTNPFHHSPSIADRVLDSPFGSPRGKGTHEEKGVAWIELDSPAVYRAKGLSSASKNNQPETNSLGIELDHRQVTSLEKDAFDGSFQSSVWRDTFGDVGSDIGDESELPSRANSFSKTTVLGPKLNITGTPEGTNMREVGSSLADRSSPGPVWTSSPPQMPALGQPARAHLKTTPSQSPSSSPKVNGGNPNKRRSGQLYDQIRDHRNQLAAEGLLPRPAQARLSPRTSPHLRGESERPFLNMSISEDPGMYGPLIPIPQTQEPFFPERAYLRRHHRENSSYGLLVSERKKNISRIVLCLCALFPPMLLLYGYGFMDNVMVSLSHGEISRFGRAEKRLALLIGWGLGVSAILGIITGMIVIGLGAR